MNQTTKSILGKAFKGTAVLFAATLAGELVKTAALNRGYDFSKVNVEFDMEREGGMIYVSGLKDAKQTLEDVTAGYAELTATTEEEFRDVSFKSEQGTIIYLPGVKAKKNRCFHARDKVEYDKIVKLAGPNDMVIISRENFERPGKLVHSVSEYIQDGFHVADITFNAEDLERKRSCTDKTDKPHEELKDAAAE